METTTHILILVDRAVALQNEGLWAEAEEILDEAERLADELEAA